MQRYTIFYQVHKGLRVLLYENALMLQRANFADVAETVPVLEKIQETLNLFDSKTRLQEVYIVPVIEPHDPELGLHLRRKRLASFRLYTRLKELLAIYTHERSPDGLVTAGKAIAKAWLQLMADCLDEMRENEEVVQKALCLYYTDQQLMRIKQYMAQTLSPGEWCTYGKCLLRGLTIPEAIGWLKDVQKFIAPATFQTLYNIAEKELSPDRFRMLMDGLTEGTMLE